MNDSKKISAAPTLQDKVGLRAPLVFAGASLLVFGLAYSLVGATLGNVLFPAQANGSLISAGDHVVGSVLVAQPFADARYFQGRPSAANNDPMAAAGSNQARSNPDLQARIAKATAQVAAREGIALAEVPKELVTQSGSGLDPHISPEGARVQVARVAKSRGMSADAVQRLVDANTEGRQFGVLGAPRVNVLRLNLALDAAHP